MSALVLLTRMASFAAPTADREVVLGDLLEEHSERRERDRGAADRWLLSQLVRSLGPWLVQRWRGFELQPALAAALAAAVAATLGARAGAAFFGYVLHLVPLRAAHGPSAGWTVLFVFLRCAFAGGAAAATLRSFAPRRKGRT